MNDDYKVSNMAPYFDGTINLTNYKVGNEYTISLPSISDPEGDSVNVEVKFDSSYRFSTFQRSSNSI